MVCIGWFLKLKVIVLLFLVVGCGVVSVVGWMNWLLFVFICGCIVVVLVVLMEVFNGWGVGVGFLVLVIVLCCSVLLLGGGGSVV